MNGSGLWQGALIATLIVLPLGLLACVLSYFGPWSRSPMERGKVGGLFYQIIALATTVAIVLAGIPEPAPLLVLPTAAGPGAPSPNRVASFDNALRAIEDGERKAPRDLWDPEYVVNQLGPDPQALFEWVRDNTHWIPYRGVLRGPVGVLMDRQGNSLDRALLLATLLEKAGHTVRLARKELSRNEAASILPSLMRPLRALAVPELTQLPAQESGLRAVVAHHELDGIATDQKFDSQTELMKRAISELPKARDRSDPAALGSPRRTARQGRLGRTVR